MKKLYINPLEFNDLIINYIKYKKNEKEVIDKCTQLIKGVIKGTTLGKSYKNFTSLSLDDLVQEGLLKIFTIFKYFDVERGDAFSFFSVVVKRHLIGVINKERKDNAYNVFKEGYNPAAFWMYSNDDEYSYINENIINLKQKFENKIKELEKEILTFYNQSNWKNYILLCRVYINVFYEPFNEINIPEFKRALKLLGEIT